MAIIYLAGPLGFSEAGRAFKDRHVVPLLTGLGHTVLDPWLLTSAEEIGRIEAMALGPARKEAWAKLNRVIGRTNVEAIDRCELVVAVLDGTDVDSGTAAEIGYAFAKGKKIVGYRGDFRLSADNEGSIVNLQVEYFIAASGGSVMRSLTALGEMLGAA